MQDDGGKKPGAKVDAGLDGGGRERRNSERVPVAMWVEEITDGAQVFRRAGNLSRGGLYLDKTIPIPVNSKVKLRFTLPGETQAIDVSAQIVSIEAEKDLGMGVKFIGLPEAVQKRIDTFLAKG